MDDTAISRPPRRRRKDARPAEIIDAGLREFAEKGFAGARLEDVARRAGIAKGTIYRYFADKEALFLAAARARVVPVFVDADAFVEAFAGSTRELLRLIVTQIYGRLVETDLRVLIRIVLAEGAIFPSLTEHYHREAIVRGRRLLDRIVARGIARGEVRPGPAADLPIVIVAPAIVASIWKMAFDRLDPIATERFLAAHLDLVCEGLLVHGR